MKEQNKKYLLNGLSWLNILILAPVFFFTVIYSAQVYVVRMHTAESHWLFLAYVAQIMLLLNLFVAAFILQVNMKREIKDQALMIVACESVICFVHGLIQICSQEHLKMYGWILHYFLISYIGVGLFILNIVGTMVYFYGFKMKKYITKFVMANGVLTLVCLIYITFIK